MRGWRRAPVSAVRAGCAGSGLARMGAPSPGGVGATRSHGGRLGYPWLPGGPSGRRSGRSLPPRPCTDVRAPVPRWLPPVARAREGVAGELGTLLSLVVDKAASWLPGSSRRGDLACKVRTAGQGCSRRPRGGLPWPGRAVSPRPGLSACGLAVTVLARKPRGKALPGRTGRRLRRATVLLEGVGEPGKSHESLLLLN